MLYHALLLPVVGAALRGTYNTTLRGADYMSCGSGVSACGVVVIESGYGSGAYMHDAPQVHGLW